MTTSTVIKVAVTGARGLLGTHCRALLHARNCGLRFRGQPEAYEAVEISRSDFEDGNRLADRLAGCAIVLHLAGINRADESALEQGNQAIAEQLAAALRQTGSAPHVVYANSTHAGRNTPYGRGKAGADEVLAAWASAAGANYTSVVLPHIFGENSVPFYNTVTATLCRQVADGVEPELNPEGEVELLHAGEAAERMLDYAEAGTTGDIRLTGRPMKVTELYRQILNFKHGYDAGILPDLRDPVDLALFNTYRSFEYPSYYPRELTIHGDPRGTLFEAVKGGGGGQTFLSWTEPGVERGNHFHRYKMERFLVVSGQADIRIRRVFDTEVITFPVSGERMEIVDMPTLHTHSIINTGSEPLLTLFWAHEIFDPEHPDTYADPVIQH